MAVYVNNITINTGEYFSRDFYLDNLDGTPLDLTGYSGSSQIRKHQNSLNPTATFLLTFVDRANGRIRLSLSAETTTTIKPGRYVYDILFTDNAGKKSIVIEGNILATADVSLGCQLSGVSAYAYDHYLLTYTATGITTTNGNYLNSRTTVTSPDPQTIAGYTGFSTVGNYYTNVFSPATSTYFDDVIANVGITTTPYLSWGGGWSTGSFSFYQSAIGNSRIVVGDSRFYDYDGSITGTAGTYLGRVYVYDLDGNLIRQINAPDGTSNGEFGTAVEIYNSKIIVSDPYYDGTHDDQGAVYVFDMNGTLERRITLSSPEEDDSWPQAMVADNGKIFTSDYYNNVYIHNLDGTGEIKITSSSLTNPDNGAFGDFPIAAGNGKFVVGDYEQVYIFNQDGTGEIMISDPTGGASGYYGDQVAIGGNKVFVADPYWENASGDYVGKIYSYDMDGTNRSDIVTTDALDVVFLDTHNAYDKQLVATEDYIWYGAQDYDGFNGAVYRWDHDGSNNIRIDPPSTKSGYTQYGQNISVDKTSDKFIIGSGDNGMGEDVHLYSYAGTSNPKRLTSGFDGFNDYVLLNVDNLLSAHSGTQEISLELRAGFELSPPPPDSFAEVKVSVTGYKGGTMEKIGGTWINANPSSSSVIGFTTSIVGIVSERSDPGTRLGLGTIDFVNGTITFT